MKTRICFCILTIALVAVSSAQAGTKEELIRIQNEVRILQQQFQEYSKSSNERLEAMYNLVTQLNDEIARSNSALSRMGTTLNSRTEDARGQEMSLLTEIRALSEKISDAQTGITVLAQQFNDFKLQASMRPAGAASSLSAETMYTQATRDFMLGDFDMAIDGFKAFVETYPAGETAAKALLNMGESYSFQNRLKEAVEAFTRVINEYPQSAVVPTALYKRANIEIALQDPESAVADFRDIVERFPTASEADLSRAELRRLESAPKQKNPPKATVPPARKTTGR